MLSVGHMSSEVADSDGGVTELQLLRKIYDEICEIRQKHADVIAATASMKAENQRRLKEETCKLKELETVHHETGRRLKDSASFSDDIEDGAQLLASLTEKYQNERDELDALRRVIDDLEFQMFEVDAQLDEEKEMIQQQLMEKQNALLNIENLFQRPELATVAPHYDVSLTSSFVAGETSRCDTFDLDESGFSVESLASHSSLVSDSANDGQQQQQQQQQQYHFSNSHSIDAASGSVNLSCDADSESSSRFIRSLPSPVRPSLPDCLPFPVFQEGINSQSVEKWDSGDLSTGCCESEDALSTASSEEILDSKPESIHRANERIHRMKKLLAVAEAEKARQVQKIGESEDELELADVHSRDRRKLGVEFDVNVYRLKHGDEASEEDADNEEMTNIGEPVVQRVHRRNDDNNNSNSRHQSRQSRPLTRYLPVRDEPLDLLRFIVDQAGHAIELCADDVIVTSHTSSGFLVKMGGRIRTWRRRWFVFDRQKRQIAYYVDDQPKHRRPRGVLDFKSIQDVYVFDLASSIKSPAPELTFCIKTSKRTYYVVAPNAEVRQLWMDVVFTGAEGYKQYE